MKKFLLSIFNFESLMTKSFPLKHFGAWTLTALILLLLETSARAVLAPIGDDLWAYWNESAGKTFEYYQNQVQDSKPYDVLAIGDSTGQLNFDVKAFEDHAKSHKVNLSAYNLAWSGNFPLAMQWSTLPLLEKQAAPKYILLFQDHGSYKDWEIVLNLESKYFQSPLIRRRMGESIISDKIFLTRLLPARTFLRDYWLGGAIDYSIPEKPECITKRKNLSNGEWTNIQDSSEELSLKYSPERRNVLYQVSEIAKKNSARLILIIPPSSHRPTSPALKEHLNWLNNLKEELNFEILNFSESTLFRPKHFCDRNHLKKEGAKILSQSIAESIFKEGLL